jgi:hypothetical protein
MESYSELAQLGHFHSSIFKTRLALSGPDIFEVFLSIAAESETGRGSAVEVPEIQSPSEYSATPATEYVKR